MEKKQLDFPPNPPILNRLNLLIQVLSSIKNQPSQLNSIKHLPTSKKRRRSQRVVDGNRSAVYTETTPTLDNPTRKIQGNSQEKMEDKEGDNNRDHPEEGGTPDNNGIPDATSTTSTNSSKEVPTAATKPINNPPQNRGNAERKIPPRQNPEIHQ